MAIALLTVQGEAAVPGAGMIPGWGEPVDPDGDCEFRREGRALAITVPGTIHELRVSPGKRNAPRVLRDNEGNFALQVKVTGDFDRGDVPALNGQNGSRSAGLVLWQDERNFVRLERSAGQTADGKGPRETLLFEYWKDGQVQRISPGSDDAPLRGPSTWLRATRRMDKLKAEVSHDGETWTEAKTISVRLSSRLRLGALATNTSKRPLNVRFEALQLKAIPLYP